MHPLFHWHKYSTMQKYCAIQSWKRGCSIYIKVTILFSKSHLQNSFAATFVVWMRTMGQREQVARSLWNKRKANKRTLSVPRAPRPAAQSKLFPGHSRQLRRWNFNRFFSLDAFLSLAHLSDDEIANADNENVCALLLLISFIQMREAFVQSSKKPAASWMGRQNSSSSKTQKTIILMT